MSKILSEFHFFLLLIDGSCFRSMPRLHDEMQFKLGLPTSYARNREALFDCLASIGSLKGNLCRNWEWTSGKRLVMSIRGFASQTADVETLATFLDCLSNANDRLMRQESLNRIWIEWVAETAEAPASDP